MGKIFESLPATCRWDFNVQQVVGVKVYYRPTIIDYSTEAEINGNKSTFTWISRDGKVVTDTNIIAPIANSPGKFHIKAHGSYHCNITNELSLPGLKYKSKTLQFNLDSERVDFTNTNLFYKLRTNYQLNSNGDLYIQKIETTNIVDKLHLKNSQLTTLTDLEKIPNIKAIDCSDNQLKTADFTAHSILSSLDITYNSLTHLNITKSPLLTELICQMNNLDTLDISKNTKLKTLRFRYNNIDTIDVKHLDSLQHLDCHANKIGHLDISNNKVLDVLFGGDNNLKSIDLSNNKKITRLFLENNQLQSINISGIDSLTYFQCQGNRLSLSEIYKIDTAKSEYSDFYYDTQYKVFDSIEGTVNTHIDFSTEAEFKGTETIFTWYYYDESIGALVDDADIEVIDKGVFRLKKKGKYTCKMTNVALQCHVYTNVVSIKESQHINIYFPTFVKVNDSLTLNATASSNLPVFYKVHAGSAEIVEGKIVFKKEGNVQLRITQPGNEEFCSITYVSFFRVRKRSHGFSIPLMAPVKVNDTIVLQANSSSGLNLKYELVTPEIQEGDSTVLGYGIIKGDTLIPTKAGLLNIQMSAGNYEYIQDTAIMKVTAQQRTQTLTFEPSLTAKVNDEVVLNASTSSGLAASYVVISGNATIADNKLSFNEAGTVVIKATAGNNEFETVEKQVSIEVTKRTQTLSFEAPTAAKVNDVVTLSAEASSTLSVQYEIVSGTATLTENKLTLTEVGTVVVKATAGNNEFETVEKQVSIEVTKRTQTLSFEVPTAAKVNDIVRLSAEASSTLSVQYEIVSGKATLIENKLTLTEIGTVVVRATAGNNEFETVEKQVSIEVTKRTQTLSFKAPTAAKVNDVVTLSAEASSTLAVQYEVVSGTATLTENKLTLTEVGTVVVQATAGNNEFETVEKQVSIEVTKRTQTLSFEAPTAAKVNDVVTLSAEASSTLAVQYEIVSGTATLTENKLTLTEVGTVVVKATAGNNEFETVEKQVSIEVTKRTHSITFNNENTAKVNDQISLNASASSGIEVSYSLVSGNAVLENNTLMPNKAGKVIVKAQAGNEEYQLAEQTLEITVSKREHTIAFNNQDTAKVNDQILLNASATSGIEVSYSLVSGNAELENNTLIPNKAGKVIVKAHAENEEYQLAEQTLEITVSKREHTIAFNNQNTAKVNDQISLNASATSGIEVSYSLVSGEAVLENNTLMPNKAGKVIVKAHAENEEYQLAVQTLEIAVSKREHTIAFNNQNTAKVNDQISLNASATSGIEVSYSLVSGDADLVNNTLTPNKAGKVIVKAQAENEEYQLAEQTLEITVSKRAQEIDFTLADTATVGNIITLNATASSSLEVSYEIVSGEATLIGNKLELTHVGELKIKAIQEGSNEFKYTELTLSIVVEKETNLINETKQEVRVYPNPAISVLNIDIAEQKGFNLTIFSSNGNMILHTTNNFATTQLNIEHLPQGIYFLHIYQKENTSIHKFIKE